MKKIIIFTSLLLACSNHLFCSESIAIPQPTIATLFEAIRGNSFNTVELLITQNKNLVNEEDRYSYSPLLVAAACNKVEITKLLIKNGANVNACRYDGFTPLMATTDPKIAELLIRNGANINAQTKNGMTPLMFATQNKSLPVATILIEFKANLHLKNDSGNTAFDIALFLQAKEIAALMSKKINVLTQAKGYIKLITGH